MSSPLDPRIWQHNFGIALESGAPPPADGSFPAADQTRPVPPDDFPIGGAAPAGGGAPPVEVPSYGPREREPQQTLANSPRRENAKFARFQVRLFDQKLYVSPGTVGFIDILDPGTIIPEFPTLDGTPLDQDASWAVGGLSLSQTYEVRLYPAEGESSLELREAEDDSDNASDYMVLAEVTFAASSGKKYIDTLNTLWQSDVLWPKNGSSSSSSSEESSSESSSEASSSSDASSEASSSGGESSDGSSGPGSSGGSEGDSGSGSDKSTAIVPVSFHPSGYAALFTMESNQVLFEFVMRAVPLRGRETRIRIDRRFLEVCETGSIHVVGAPCGDLPYPVGAEVVHGTLILRAQARADRRPKKVSLKLTGVRKGFANFNMPSRTKAQFLANEKFLNSAYPKA